MHINVHKYVLVQYTCKMNTVHVHKMRAARESNSREEKRRKNKNREYEIREEKYNVHVQMYMT